MGGRGGEDDAAFQPRVRGCAYKLICFHIVIGLNSILNGFVVSSVAYNTVLYCFTTVEP